jgi:hypothetical protein
MLEAATTAITPASNDLGRDHGALALLPIALALRQPSKHQGPVTFDYELPLDDRSRRFCVTLTPGASGQLPVHGDQVVYLALIQLALRNDKPAEPLLFRRMDLFDLLRWPRAGRSYERLQGALDRLHELSIKLDTAVIARDGRQYERVREASHLIERYRLDTSRDAECTVEWGHLVREAFRLGDFKRLDWDLLLSLDNPLTAQLYRLLDRVTLAGHTQWAVEWQPLADALGMDSTNCTRPAKIRERLEPHFATLASHGVIDSVEYQRGGTFVFYIRNYLRAQLRRVLTESFGVYPAAAAQIVSGYDEPVVMAQCDCLRFGQRGKPASPGGYLTDAIRNNYELRYADDAPLQFTAMWGVYGSEERRCYQQAGVALLGAADDLFETSSDPTAWSPKMRAVVRFMMVHNLDPELVSRQPAVGLLGGVVG